ncbi:hypothetical protein psal_cds_42 [Pandoravirus salinus]|uniref:Uncharacterized protein n=1 Tax=Pandoravirus salinus TaxID=1349410 RepID=S4W025_9VIRU|nr:hypothetical protein psal_cds_42 [Pandoravirus salinus]AGO83425.1 hypothetical protein psal_cds_42 [Pandoravirus salinus]
MEHEGAAKEPRKGAAWSARFEATIPPTRPYVPRAHIMNDAACAAAAAGLPADATAVVVLQIEGVRDDARARGWPFVDRRLTLTIASNRPGGEGAVADTRPSGALGWRRVAWSADEAAAWTREIGTDAEAVMAGADYDEHMWGAPMAAFMVAMREHAKNRGPKPERPPPLGCTPHGRPVVVGWLGPMDMPEVSDALALHLGTWSQQPGACSVDA